MKTEVKPLLIVLLAVYNLFYGAVCWKTGGINGLLFGSIVMASAGIVGVLIRNNKNANIFKLQHP